MDTQKYQAILIRVLIEEVDEGWYIATSPDLLGLVLADKDRNAIVDDLPAAIELLYSERYNCKCKVVQASYGEAEPDRPKSSQSSYFDDLWTVLLDGATTNRVVAV